MTRDIQLRDTIADLTASGWSGEVYRACWLGRPVLQGSSGGGRWCPRYVFEVLYTSLTMEGAIAEIDAWLNDLTPRPTRPIEIHKIEVEIRNAVTLDHDTLARLGLEITQFKERTYDRTQQIGDAAHFLGYDGMFVPSARWNGTNLVLFLGNHSGDSTLRPIEAEEVDWHRWRARWPQS